MRITKLKNSKKIRKFNYFIEFTYLKNENE